MHLTFSVQVSDDVACGASAGVALASASLAVILQAGEWTSPAFLTYLDCNGLEGDVVLSAHCDESSSDEEPQSLCSQCLRRICTPKFKCV